MLTVATPTSNSIEQGYNSVWGTITGAIPGLQTFLITVGIICFLYAVGTFLAAKFRNRPSPSLMWPIIVGAVCTLPTVFLPIAAKFADWFVSVIGAFGQQA